MSPAPSTNPLGALTKALQGAGFDGKLLTDYEYNLPDSYVGTGNYLLNAQLTGSLFRGYPEGRIMGLAGDSGTGKTFLCLNACREAQRQGYTIIYIDTEGAVERETADQFGIDPQRFFLQQIDTIEQVGIFCSSLTNEVMKAKPADRPKYLLVIDSLGNLVPQKDKDDLKAGKMPTDMGARAKMMRKLFRVITMDLHRARLLTLVTNHTSTDTSGYVPMKKWSGGEGGIYAASGIIMLSKSKVKEGTDVVGIKVTSRVDKNRFARAIPVEFYISFVESMNPYAGLEQYVSWEACGIQRGKLLTLAEAEKLKGEDRDRVLATAYEHEGKTYCFQGSETARMYAVKHLGMGVYPRNLLNHQVFTTEVLEQLDRNVIKDHFKLPDQTEALGDFLHDAQPEEEDE